MSIKIHDFDGRASLFFATGESEADDAILASGHGPNGYFWEGSSSSPGHTSRIG